MTEGTLTVISDPGPSETMNDAPPPEPPTGSVEALSDSIETQAAAEVTIAEIQATRDVELATIAAETEEARIAADLRHADLIAQLQKDLAECLTRLETLESSSTPPTPDPLPSPPESLAEAPEAPIEPQAASPAPEPPEPPKAKPRRHRWI
jgi:hypothetical protein